jgi:hypothetical protein
MKSETPKNGRSRTPTSETRPRGGSSDLESLLRAIVEDDRSAARELIRRNPSLSTGLVDEARMYESKIAHWLYVNDSALHLAAAGHREVIARMLLAAGADVNSAGNHRQGRPLHYAADGYIVSPTFHAARQVKTIQCLLSAGAELHGIDKNGATALHRAVRTRCAAAVECLLQAGADPAAGNHSGATPFHLAVQNTGRGGSGDPAAKAAQRRIIESMLALGVSPTMKDSRGKSVFDWATSEWIRQLLSEGIHRSG